jgi:hypothetical protein
MEHNVGGLKCDHCWGSVDKLWSGRFGGYLCWLCWSKLEGDTPESRRKEPALTTDNSLEWIKPRRMDKLERCPDCKTEARVEGSYRPGAVYHPAHPSSSCTVTVDGARCGCRHKLATGYG